MKRFSLVYLGVVFGHFIRHLGLLINSDTPLAECQGQIVCTTLMLIGASMVLRWLCVGNLKSGE